MFTRQSFLNAAFVVIVLAGFVAMGPAPITAHQDLTLVRVSPGAVAQSIATHERAATNVAARE
jgi:hypothetical protein